MRNITLLSVEDKLDMAVINSVMNARGDGQALYTGDTPRTLLFSLLRFLKMDHNRELAQTLPARELHELVISDRVFSHPRRLGKPLVRLRWSHYQEGKGRDIGSPQRSQAHRSRSTASSPTNRQNLQNREDGRRPLLQSILSHSPSDVHPRTSFQVEVHPSLLFGARLGGSYRTVSFQIRGRGST